MLITNVKSNADLVGKKKLQADLLELSIANESELEKRVKDYKNPNKPIPIAPEYKTNAELQKDRLAQERQAIANMEEFGFDYNKSADLVAWLSSSLVNRLIEFNANFKGIKKELVEKTNPKLLTVDYLKNYLENYFEDMDVNFGRKFGQRELDGLALPTTIDELTNLIPIDELDDMLDAIQDVIPQLIQTSRDFQIQIYGNDDVVGKIAEIEGLENGIKSEANAEIRKTLTARKIEEEKQLKSLQNRKQEISNTYNKLMNVYDLFFLYSKVLPSQQILTVMKQSLTQQERADMIRRYVGVLRKMKILTREGTQELISEFGKGDMSNWLRKANNSLSFLANDANLKAIQKIQDDYTFLITHSNRVADAGNIQQLNEIRKQEIIEAKKAIIEGRDDDPINIDLKAPRRFGKIEIEADAQTSLQKRFLNQKYDDELQTAQDNDAYLERERQQGFVRDRVFNRIGIEPPPTRPISNLSKSEIEKIRSQQPNRLKLTKGDVKRLKGEKLGKDTTDLSQLKRTKPSGLESDISLQSDFGTNLTSSIIPFPSIKSDINVNEYAKEAEDYILEYAFQQNEAIEELKEIYAIDKKQGVDTARNYLLLYAGTQEDVDFLNAPTGANKINFNRFVSQIKKIMKEKLKQMIEIIKSDGLRKSKIRDEARKNKEPIPPLESFDYNQFTEGVQRAEIGDTGEETKYGIGTKKGRGLPKKIIKHLREDDAENKALSKAFKKHMKIEKEVNGDSSDEEKGGALKFKHKKIKVGKGISVVAQPAYKTFGKYVIHMGHLIDKNVANFKYPSLGSIPAIKPLTVSDDYKDFIMDTLENGKPNDRIFSKLPQEEQKHFERVVLGAGLLDAFKLRRTKSDSEKKDADRFNILRGEVMAGNNSEKVIKELRGLIIRFMNEGRIQQKEGTGMLVELSAI